MLIGMTKIQLLSVVYFLVTYRLDIKKVMLSILILYMHIQGISKSITKLGEEILHKKRMVLIPV